MSKFFIAKPETIKKAIAREKEIADGKKMQGWGTEAKNYAIDCANQFTINKLEAALITSRSMGLQYGIMGVCSNEGRAGR